MNSCLRLAGVAILAAITCSHADPVEPLTKTKSPAPPKAQVLLISSRLDAAAGLTIQKALEDTALISRVIENIPSGDALAAGIDRWVGDKKWDVILLDAPLGNAPDAILSRLRSSAKVVVPNDGKFPPAPACVVNPSYADAPERLRRVVDAIVAGLLQDRPRWAELPTGEKHDPRRLCSDPRLLEAPETIPLAQSETATVYRAREGLWQFNMHPFIT